MSTFATEVRYPKGQDWFTGEIVLDNPSGTFYPDHDQKDDLTLSVVHNSRVLGGCAFIYIKASGDAINVPADWELISADGISTSVGDINKIAIMYAGNDRVQYGVVVESA